MAAGAEPLISDWAKALHAYHYKPCLIHKIFREICTAGKQEDAADPPRGNEAALQAQAALTGAASIHPPLFHRC